METSEKKEETKKPVDEGKAEEDKDDKSTAEEITAVKKRLEEIEISLKQKSEFMTDIRSFFRGEEITMLV